MQKIKQLPLHEAQKIAAGEVVERPANVVKELVENSIDAGATKISVHLQDGGKNLIRVVDNGCGMSREDARLCFAQHATSKISSVDDLQSITTFGFRGEALASIAAVSKIILITQEKNGDGIKIELAAGNITNEHVAACTVGTDISIQTIFYNLPARQKFLKKKETESRQVTLLLQAFCLDYLTIHFKFFQNGREIFNCPPVQNLIDRTAQLWDHTFAKQMIPLEAQTALPAEALRKGGTVKLSGVISNHQYFRYDRSAIFLFVNKRWIKDQHIARALLRGYQNVLPPARYPAACLFITVDPTQIDINIHPRKEEVQFLHPRTITTLVQKTVKAALEQYLSSHINPSSLKLLRTGPPSRKASDFVKTTTDRSEGKPVIHPFSSARVPHPSTPLATSGRPIITFPVAQTSGRPVITFPVAGETIADEQPQQTFTEQATIHAADEKREAQQKNYQLIGQYKKTYLLLEKQDGLFLVDQHAAHERILYELFSKRFDDVATVQLMFPQIIDLNADDMNTVTPHLDIFCKNGITIEPFSETQLTITATPVHIKNIKLDELVRQVASWIRETDTVDEQKFLKVMNEKLHAQMACKAAVKAGNMLTQQQMERLLENLYKANNRLTCPHGRPTGWLLHLYEIEKKFKRVL